MAPTRAVIRIQLDAAAKDSLDDLCSRRGMTQISIMSRLVSWFASQDEVVQAWVLGGFSEAAMAPLLRRVIEKLEKPRPRKTR